MAYSDEKDLFPFIGRDEDTDIILFFTDGKGEPRKLNVRRAIEGDTDFTGNALGYSGSDLEDFISACPKVPSKPIQFSWNRNVEFESNFQETNGIQFAYQNVYIDGFVTAISPLSEVAFPPSIQTLGSGSISSVTVESECILQVPQQGSEVSSIRILFREGNDGSFKMIDEVSNVSDLNNDLFDYFPDGTVLGYYTFRNDSVYPIVPSSQTSKNFDNLPRRAKAQSVSGNRLMYGNYLEGFNPIQTKASSAVIFSNVDQNAVSIEGQIKTINVFSDKTRNGGARGESIGFSVDVGTEPIEPGVYRLSVDLSPEQNYHLFNAKAYHPSKNQTFNGESDYTFDGLTTDASGDIADGLFKINPMEDESAITATNGTEMLYGFDPGRAGITNFQWNNSGGDSVTAAIGTTAANPLIIPTAPLNVTVVVEVVEQIESSVFLSAIDSCIANGTSNTAYVNVINYSGAFLDESSYGFSDADLASAPGVRTVVESRSGLNSKDEFLANSSFADRISFVPYPDTGNFTNEVNGAPAGFFIVNSADMLLNVKRVLNDTSGATSPVFASGNGNPQSTTKAYYRFEVVAIRNPEILTCIPEPVSGLGYAESEENSLTSAPRLPWVLGVEPSEGTNSNTQFNWPLVLGAATEDGNEPIYPAITNFGNVSGAEAFGGDGRVSLLTDFPIPAETGVEYVFNDGDGNVFLAEVTEFDTLLGVNRVTVQNPVNFVAGSAPTIPKKWTFHKNISSSGQADTPNPNFPRGAAIKDRNGNYLNFDLLSVAGQICPIAIGKWKVFSSDDIADDSWQESFSYTWTNNAGSVVTVTPGSTNSWFGAMSKTWAGREIAIGNDISINASSQEAGGTFTSIIDGAAGVGSFIGGDNGYSSIADNEYFFAKAIGDYGGISSAAQDYISANTGAATPVSNRRGTIWNTTLLGIHENFKFLKSDATQNSDAEGYNTPTSPTDQELSAAPLQDLGSFLDIGVEGSSISSFKTRDFHDFGIVYFDKRGRAGTVNPLPSVYVPGYSDSEREQDEKGAAAVRYNITHLPPDWASSYKIVYAGSANTERFIQYSSGGAYVEPNIIGGNNEKIYVSLNYLQNNRASYVRSYGASDQDTGEPTLYRFTPGDKLRVISYYTDDKTIVYAPKGYDFDVVGVEEISPEQNNPLIDEAVGEGGVDVTKVGSFLLLKNNLQASGFTAADISGGTDKWADRCIFEVVTQRKSRGEEIKPYYETPFGGRIIVENGRKVHEYGTITIDQGDVYFRKVPVNLRPYDSDQSTFTDIIGQDDSNNETSQARLRSYYLESQSVTDLYRSNAKNYGKAHFVIDGYSERINDTSIIYSDATNQESFNLFYTSFNPLSKNYFDLPAKYGDIDYIADAGDQIYVAQNSKIGKIQVNKSLTSTASGSDTLNLSKEVLNSPRFFLEDVGTGGHPESVTWDDSTMYFVDQGRGVVVSAGETGMKFLSSAGMEKFFKKLLAKYKTNSRITTGVNPFTDELVVSVMSNDSKNNLSPTPLTTLVSNDVNTISYDLATGSWITSYTFYSSEYANVGDRMISFKNRVVGDVSNIAWKHDDGAKNSFYGVSYPSFFTSVLVDNANLTKDFKSISIDGSKPWDLSLSTSKESSRLYKFKDYEGTFYTEISRSENDSSKNNIKGVGKISSISKVSDSQYDLKFERDISEYHITLTGMTLNKTSEVLFYDPAIPVINAYQFVSTNDAVISIHPIKIVDKYTLRVQFSQTPDESNQDIFLEEYVNKGVLVKSDSKFFGDSLRDKFITITASSFPTGSTDKTELYSINVDYIESNLNSSR